MAGMSTKSPLSIPGVVIKVYSIRIQVVYLGILLNQLNKSANPDLFLLNPYLLTLEAIISRA